MLKKYNQFITEKFSPHLFNKYYDLVMRTDNYDMSDRNWRYAKEKLIEIRDEFAEKVKGLSYYFDSYFTKLAASSEDPEQDFNEMQKVIDRTGYTLEVISRLFDLKICKFTTEFFPYFIGKNNLDEINGYIDIYLYLLDKKLKISEKTRNEYTVKLGGGELDNFVEENNLDEFLIKYAYGYHKTSYGKMFLEQLNMKPEDFTKRVMQLLLSNLYRKYLTEYEFRGTDLETKDKIYMILQDIEEDGGLIETNENSAVIFLERFHLIFDSKIPDYEEFKINFINWLNSECSIPKESIEDRDHSLTVKF